MELYLLPIRYQLDQLVKATAIQIRTGPTHSIPKDMLQRRTDHQLTLSGYTPIQTYTYTKNRCLRAPRGTLAGE